MAIPSWFQNMAKLKNWDDVKTLAEWSKYEKESTPYYIQALDTYSDLSRFYDEVWAMPGEEIYKRKKLLLIKAESFSRRGKTIRNDIYRKYSNLIYGTAAPGIRGSILYRTDIFTESSTAGYYYYPYDTPISKYAKSDDLKTPRTKYWLRHPFITENLDDALRLIDTLSENLAFDIESWAIKVIEVEELIGTDADKGGTIYYNSRKEVYRLWKTHEEVDKVKHETVTIKEELIRDDIEYIGIDVTYSCETGTGHEPFYAEITAETVVSKKGMEEIMNITEEMRDKVDVYLHGQFMDDYNNDDTLRNALLGNINVLKEGVQYHSKEYDATLKGKNLIKITWEQKEHTFSVFGKIAKSRDGKKPYSPVTKEYDIVTEKVE